MSVATHSRAPVVTDWAERYQVVAKIGAGGFADVYEAIDLKLDREVALKVVDERHGVSARVVREVEAAASLTHPGIVALYDFFTDGRRAYLVWELVRGRSLAELAGGLDDGEAAEAAAQVLEALAYAHSQGVVHRDVKPQNVMVDERGHVKVMDFGIARLMDAETLTSEGDMLGTVAYMSPEQAAGRRAGPPSDVYSAAMVLYELLAGTNPLRGATPGETISNVLAGRLPSLRELSPRPARRAHRRGRRRRCCRRRPSVPAALELSEALRAVAGRLGGRASRAAPPRPARRPLARLAPFAERTLGALLAGADGRGGALVAAGLPGRLEAPARPGHAAGLVRRAAGRARLASRRARLSRLQHRARRRSRLPRLRARPLRAHRAPPARAPCTRRWRSLLLPVYGVFAAPALAALLGRVRGPLVAAWAGAATCIFLLFGGAVRSPFAGFVAHGTLARHDLGGANPVPIVARVASAASAGPCLFQALVWAGFALAVASCSCCRGSSASVAVVALVRGAVRSLSRRAHRRLAPPRPADRARGEHRRGGRRALLVAILLEWSLRARAQPACGRGRSEPPALASPRRAPDRRRSRRPSGRARRDAPDAARRSLPPRRV